MPVVVREAFSSLPFFATVGVKGAVREQVSVARSTAGGGETIVSLQPNVLLRDWSLFREPNRPLKKGRGSYKKMRRAHKKWAACEKSKASAPPCVSFFFFKYTVPHGVVFISTPVFYLVHQDSPLLAASPARARVHFGRSFLSKRTNTGARRRRKPLDKKSASPIDNDDNDIKCWATRESTAPQKKGDDSKSGEGRGVILCAGARRHRNSDTGARAHTKKCIGAMAPLSPFRSAVGPCPRAPSDSWSATT